MMLRWRKSHVAGTGNKRKTKVLLTDNVDEAIKEAIDFQSKKGKMKIL
jgi:hypothetical protein